jgi:hypothetical protein
MEHLNIQGLKQCNRYSSSTLNSELYLQEEQDKVAHTMKVFRILCLIIHSQVSGLPALIKDNVLLPSCLHAITKVQAKQDEIETGILFF